MAGQWYCQIGESEYGPLTAEQLKAMARDGKLAADDFVRQDTQGRWVPASRVKGLFSASSSSSIHPARTESGKFRTAGSDSSSGIKRAKPLKESGGSAVQAARRPKVPPVASPPKAAPPVRQVPLGAVPVGTVPVGTVPVGTVPVGTVVAPPPVPSLEANGHAKGHTPLGRRRKSLVPLIVGMLALLAVPAALGVVLLVVSQERSKKSPAPPPATVAESAPKAVDPEATNDAAAAPAASVATPAAAKPAGRDEDVRVIQSVSQWVDASRKMLGVGSVRFKVASAWVEASTAATSEAAEAGRRLCLEVELTNSSRDKVLNYSSWNGTGMLGGDASAMLVIEENQLTDPLPVSAGPSPDRLTNRTLAPGEIAKDELVFAMPPGELADVQIVFPQAAVGRTGYFGVLIPRVMLVSGSRPHDGEGDAGQPARGPDQAAGPATLPEAMPQELPPEVAPAVPAPAEQPPAAQPKPGPDNGGLPGTIDDLKRQINDDP